MQYNGHRNWTHWNVALWLMNDEGLYMWVKKEVRIAQNMDQAAEGILYALHDAGITHTPDGAQYSKTAIRQAIRDWR